MPPQVRKVPLKVLCSSLETNCLYEFSHKVWLKSTQMNLSPFILFS